MNPLTNVRNLQKINERELELGLVGKKSWHDKYKDSAWIFVGGLPYDLTEGDIVCVFSQYGEIVNINLVRDKQSGKSKGYAFLCYEDQRSTVLSVDNLNGIKVLGRTLRVDHVEEYKQPKEFGDEDDMTKQLRSEGIAPTAPKSEEEEEEEEIYPSKKPKKAKKEKKKKKKKEKKKSAKQESSDSDSDNDDFQNRGIKRKHTETHDRKGGDKWTDSKYEDQRSARDRNGDYKHDKYRDRLNDEKRNRDREHSPQNGGGTSRHRDRSRDRDVPRERERARDYSPERRDRYRDDYCEKERYRDDYSEKERYRDKWEREDRRDRYREKR